MNEAEITRLQRLIPRRPVTLRTRNDYRRTARWLELEARRGYVSSAQSLRYANNMRWAAEVVWMTGRPGTWTELQNRNRTERT